MSKKTLKEEVLNTKTWSELTREALREAEKLSDEFMRSQVNQLVELYIEGSSKEVVHSRAKSIFDQEEVLEKVTERLTFLLSISEVEDLRRQHSEELQAQEEWKQELEALLLNSSRLPNGNWYWEFSCLNDSWEFKVKLQELKAQGRLVGGGRDGFYTDQPSPGLIRFTVVKFAD